VKPEPVKPEPAKPEPAKVEAAKVEAAHVEAPIVNELPARKKARELTQKAIASLRANDFAAAEPVLVRAVLVDPSYADAWRHLGIARAQLGDRANARRAYKKYLTLSPDAPDAEQVKAILASP
jgi:Flp pilus assembly protein TadD